MLDIFMEDLYETTRSQKETRRKMLSDIKELYFFIFAKKNIKNLISHKS